MYVFVQYVCEMNVCICMHVCVYVCMRMHVCVRIYACMIHVLVCMYYCMYVYVPYVTKSLGTFII